MANIEEIVRARLAKAENEYIELDEKRRQLQWRIDEYRELLGGRKDQSGNGLRDQSQNATHDHRRFSKGNWEDAVKKSFQKTKPATGWPN